uniref:Integral membrane bound transporter domain-containing protein n=1 Tax=Kalanchoe fedtschenkoi TaxID=63787 RepID=A0A7N0TYJ5_KALFE
MYQGRAWWMSRLGCGLRTVIACTIVASITLYGPMKIRRIPSYPAFGYLTVILVVPQRTLGDTLGSFWHVLYATIQVMPAAIVSLMVMKPGEDISYAKAAVAIAVSSFMVGLPKSSSLLTKRIAFVQIVLVYAGAVIHGKSTGVLMHPVHIAASTLHGALASVVALLLPFPRLAYSEVKKECCLYAGNASKRLGFLVNAFCAENKQAAADLLLQANSASKAGSLLIQSIKLKRDGMAWERRMVRFMKPSAVKPADRLQNLEIPLRGMEMAMNYWTRSPNMIITQDVIDTVRNMEGQIDLKLEQVRLLMPFDATTAPETKVESPRKPLLNLASIPPPTIKDLPVFFFLFCMRVLQEDFPFCSNLKQEKDENESNGVYKGLLDRLVLTIRGRDLIFALKCSLSLGVAVYLGLHYAKENAYWSGLTIAISFVTGRQPAFNVANSRAQGTALGSVYGVLGCFILQNHIKYRFVLVLPWILLISFLRRSRMFGEAWGISAAIGGLLILGRNNYRQPPNVFAITRITEAVIGLSCFILVELILQPRRASTLAKIEVAQSLQSFQECIQQIKLCPLEEQVSPFQPAMALRQNQKTLESHVEELRRLVEEAEVEPNFWFLPFNSLVYRNLLNSFSKAVDLLSFIACISETLLRISRRSESSSSQEFQTRVDEDLKLFSEKLCSSLRGLEDVMLIKSVAALERALKRKASIKDIESGKPAKYAFRLMSDDQAHIDIIANSLLGLSVESFRDEKLQSQTFLCLAALGFCITCLTQEATVMETEIKELVRWENPAEPIDLLEISSKVNCLKESIKAGCISTADFVASIRSKSLI